MDRNLMMIPPPANVKTPVLTLAEFVSLKQSEAAVFADCFSAAIADEQHKHQNMNLAEWEAALEAWHILSREQAEVYPKGH